MNKKTHTSLVSLSHLLKWLINPAHSKLLTRNPKSSRVTRVSFTLLRNRATNDHIGRILKIVPSFHGKSGEGFQIFNFLDSGPFKSPTKPEISGCSVPRPCFQKKPPPNLHLNASGAQSRTLTSAWGFPRQSLSYEHFFLILPEKVAGVLGTHQLTKRFNCPQKKGTVVTVCHSHWCRGYEVRGASTGTVSAVVYRQFETFDTGELHTQMYARFWTWK